MYDSVKRLEDTEFPRKYSNVRKELMSWIKRIYNCFENTHERYNFLQLETQSIFIGNYLQKIIKSSRLK